MVFLGYFIWKLFKKRLEREFDLDLITTAPSVIYKVTSSNGEVLMIQNPINLPPQQEISVMEEPIVSATIMVPLIHYVGAVMELCRIVAGNEKHAIY